MGMFGKMGRGLRLRELIGFFFFSFFFFKRS